MESKEVFITGSEHYSEIQCDRLVVPGAGTIDGNVEASEIDITGTLVVDGKVKSTNLSVSGMLRVDSGISSEDMVLTGCVHSGGHTNIGILTIQGCGKIYDATIDELYGEQLTGNSIIADLLDFGNCSECGD